MEQTLVITNIKGKTLNTFKWTDEATIYKNLYNCYKQKVERPSNVKRITITKPYYEKTICRIVYESDPLEPTIYTYTTIGA